MAARPVFLMDIDSGSGLKARVRRFSMIHPPPPYPSPRSPDKGATWYEQASPKAIVQVSARVACGLLGDYFGNDFAKLRNIARCVAVAAIRPVYGH